jgi:hypothetical protein
MGLLLAEELLLLAHGRDGSPLIGETARECGVAGGLLADLAAQGKIACRDSQVVVIDPAAPGHEVLDTVLRQIAAQNPCQRPRWWVDQLAAQEWASPLVNQMFKHGTWKIPVPRTELLASLADTLTSDAEPDPHTAALYALADACRLSGKTFPYLDPRRKAAMSAGQWAATGVHQAVRAAAARRRALDAACRIVAVLTGG